MKQYISLAAIVFFLAGCSEGIYEFNRAGNQTFLLNKITGDAKLVDGVNLVPLKPPESGQSDAKIWPDETLPSLGKNPVVISVRTKYRDGKMQYFVKASPYVGVLESARASAYLTPTVVVHGVDKDNFEIEEEIRLPLKSATKTVTSEGKPTHLEWMGSVAMSIESYRSMQRLNFMWFGFPESK